jgi:hypothetical protein
MAGAVEAKVRDEPLDTPAPAERSESGQPEPQQQAQPEPASRPQDVDALDALLSEYDQGIKDQPQQPEQQEPPLDPLADQRLDSALSAVDREIQAKAQTFVDGEIEKSRLAQAFESHVAGIQQRCPDYVPDDYAKSELLAMSLSDPRLEVAFRAAAQGVSRPQIMAELDRVNGALQHAARNPTADPNVIPQLQRMAHELAIAFHANTILRQAEAAIIKKANSRPPIDPDLTADRALVAASMKGSSRPVEADPPPAFGQMGDAEFRNFTRRNYGF